MIRSLISQLYCRWQDTRKHLDSLFSSCNDGSRQPTYELLWKTLLHMIGQAKEVWIVLDALDKCSTKRDPPAEGLLSWMKDLLNSEQRNAHRLMTGWPEEDIKLELSELLHYGNVVPILADNVTDDIRAYVHTRVREDSGLKRWQKRPNVQEEIENRLLKNANAM